MKFFEKIDMWRFLLVCLLIFTVGKFIYDLGKGDFEKDVYEKVVEIRNCLREASDLESEGNFSGSMDVLLECRIIIEDVRSELKEGFWYDFLGLFDYIILGRYHFLDFLENAGKEGYDESFLKEKLNKSLEYFMLARDSLRNLKERYPEEYEELDLGAYETIIEETIEILKAGNISDIISR